MGGVPPGVVPDSDDEGRALRIPYAIYRKKGGLTVEARLITPIQAKEEGLHHSQGFFFCQLCHGELDARLEGRIRTAYFAHRPGQGEDCDRRSGGTETYTSELRTDWQRDLQNRHRSLPMALALIPRTTDIIIKGSGPVLSAEEYSRQSTDAPQGPISVGMEGTFAAAQLAWTRGEFQVKVIDPLSAKIEWTSPLRRFIWSPRVSPDERGGGFLVFVGSGTGVAVQPADMAGVPETLWIVFHSPVDRVAVLPNGLKRVLSEADLSLDLSLLSPLPVSGARQWFAVKPNWDWGSGIPRRFLRCARIHIGVRRRVMTVVSLDGDVRSTPDATSIALVEGRGRLLVSPEILGQLVVELVPLPFNPEGISRQRVGSRGKILNVVLQQGERIGEFYILALDPLDNARFLLAHRVSVLRGRDLGDVASETFDLGVRVTLFGQTRLLSPLAREEALIDFRALMRSRSDVPSAGIELVVPPRASDEEYVHPPIEVRGYTSLTHPAEALVKEEVADVARFNHVVELLARDEQIIAIGIRFGLLGECRIVRDTGFSSGRFRLRLDLARRIWAEYEGSHRLAASKRAAIIASVVPMEDSTHGWDAEVNHLHKLIRINEGRTAAAAESVAAYIVSKGLPQGLLPDLGDDDIGTWLALLLKSRDGT